MVEGLQKIWLHKTLIQIVEWASPPALDMTCCHGQIVRFVNLTVIQSFSHPVTKLRTHLTSKHNLACSSFSSPCRRQGRGIGECCPSILCLIRNISAVRPKRVRWHCLHLLVVLPKSPKKKEKRKEKKKNNNGKIEITFLSFCNTFRHFVWEPLKLGITYAWKFHLAKQVNRG